MRGAGGRGAGGDVDTRSLSATDRSAFPAGAGRGGPQRIPRPSSACSGAPAPWADRAPAVVTVADVAAAFARQPAVAGQSVLVPVPELPLSGWRQAAVLCAVFDWPAGAATCAGASEAQAHVVLTRRSTRLRSHTGEVAFPGGRLEPGEEPLAAALREAHEEVGIDPAGVEILGRLSSLSTVAHPAPILPFVGSLAGPPQLVPNPAEVDRAFTVALVDLLGPGVYHEELWAGPEGEQRPVHFFDVVGDTVWGATARMLRELLALLVVPY